VSFDDGAPPALPSVDPFNVGSREGGTGSVVSFQGSRRGATVSIPTIGGLTGSTVVRASETTPWLTDRRARARGPQQSVPPAGLGAAFPDVLLAAQANAGWAFERLFESQGRSVVSYLRSQGAADPDGTANEVFLRAFRGLTTFQGDEGAFRGWLFVIARNCLIDERRRQARRPVVVAATDVDGPAAPGADQGAFEQLGAERVHDLLNELSPDQRDVLLLRIVADLTVDQTASALGKQPGAVKQLQRRGLAALRKRIEKGSTRDQ
jgi:RNA polymerase sigma factor (sigma-70 family)